MRNFLLLIVCALTFSLLGACGNSEVQEEGLEDNSAGAAGGTMLADQKAPEVSGEIKSISAEEAVVTVDGQDVTYRLSEDAGNQAQNGEVEVGSEVSFTTYSIGDDKHTIDKFQ